MSKWSDDIWSDEMMSSPRPPRGLERKAVLARLVEAMERIWPYLWRPAAAAALIVILSLFGLWLWLPGWLHVLALIIFLALLAVDLRRLVRDIRLPSRRQALARLERDSGFRHNPLFALEDRAAGRFNGLTDALWRSHLRRLAPTAAQPRLRAPALSWLSQDPWALRGALLLMLALGFAMAGERAGERFRLAFTPDFGGAPADVKLDAWVTPPSYTGQAPIMLSRLGESADAPIEIPAGSTLTALMSGGWRTPYLTVDGGDYDFTEQGKEAYRLELTLNRGDAISISQGGRARAYWPVNILPDAPPVAVFPAKPAASLSQAMRVEYQVFDDYGVTELSLRVARPEDRYHGPLDIALGIPRITDKKPATQISYQDLTESPWAGEEVTLMLAAKDAIGQVGKSLPMPYVLPEREFKHPLAQRVIAIRKSLFRNPKERKWPAQQLDMLARRPADYDGDLSVFVGLRDAYWRLAHDKEDAAVDSIAAVLWDVALHLEDGGASQAQADMREAMKRMMAALSQGQDVDQLTKELERRIQDFLRSQMQNMAKAGQDGQPQMSGGETQAISSDMLSRMLEQIRQMAASGDMKGAMEMLAQLQSMMENMQFAQGQGQEGLDQARAANKALQGLEALSRMQRDLMNDTARQAMRGPSGLPQPGAQAGRRAGPGQTPGEGQGEGAGQGRGQDQGLSGQQGKLGDMLRGIMGDLSGAGLGNPGGLGDAQAYMDSAANSLGRGRMLPAIREQSGALNALEQAQGELQKALDKAMQRIQARAGNRDPLGRQSGGAATEDVSIPTEADFNKSHAILEELRRRIADPKRSKVERDYLRRLLERF